MRDLEAAVDSPPNRCENASAEASRDDTDYRLCCNVLPFLRSTTCGLRVLPTDPDSCVRTGPDRIMAVNKSSQRLRKG